MGVPSVQSRAFLPSVDRQADFMSVIRVFSRLNGLSGLCEFTRQLHGTTSWQMNWEAWEQMKILMGMADKSKSITVYECKLLPLILLMHSVGREHVLSILQVFRRRKEEKKTPFLLQKVVWLFFKNPSGLRLNDVFFFFISLFLATTATATANPHNSIPVGTAHLVAQACAFHPSCHAASSPATHTPCCQPP